MWTLVRVNPHLPHCVVMYSSYESLRIFCNSFFFGFFRFVVVCSCMCCMSDTTTLNLAGYLQGPFAICKFEAAANASATSMRCFVATCNCVACCMLRAGFLFSQSCIRKWSRMFTCCGRLHAITLITLQRSAMAWKCIRGFLWCVKRNMYANAKKSKKKNEKEPNANRWCCRLRQVKRGHR